MEALLFESIQTSFAVIFAVNCCFTAIDIIDLTNLTDQIY